MMGRGFVLVFSVSVANPNPGVFVNSHFLPMGLCLIKNVISRA